MSFVPLLLAPLMMSLTGPGCEPADGQFWSYHDSLRFMHPRFAPQWAGTDRIVFSGASNHGGEFYVVSSDGSDLRRLSANKGNPARIDYAPDVSPNGDRIVYATSRHRTAFGGGPHFDIEITDLRGKLRKRLSEDESHELSPRWSPVRESIVFMRTQISGDKRGIYLMDTNGGNLRTVFPLSSVSPN